MQIENISGSFLLFVLFHNKQNLLEISDEHQ